MYKFTNPISGPAKILFNKDLSIGSFPKTVIENRRRVYNHINKYVQDRKKGLTKSQMDGADFLSVFLESKEIFDDKRIVDGILGFIMTAVETTHYTTQTLISHFAKDKASLARARQEFEDSIYKPAIEEDPSLASLSRPDFIQKTLDLETTMDLPYMAMCM